MYFCKDGRKLWYTSVGLIISVALLVILTWQVSNEKDDYWKIGIVLSTYI